MYTLSPEEVLQKLESNAEKGLDSKQAARRLASFGRNEFHQKKKKGPLRRFFEQFQDFMILVLIAAAILSFLVSVLQGEADFTDTLIILAIVILNAVLGVIQEEKAEKSLEALRNISAPMALVRRNGEYLEISAGELVPGDIIRVEAGNYVPADARILESVSLYTDESALTGESVPAEKREEICLPGGTPLAERCNMLYSTTVVTGGHAKAVVTATGMKTEVGKIADMILNEEAPATPLQKRLADTGKWLGGVALAICVVIFILGTMQGRDIFDMFMTSVSLAVAAIPEALPGMVTIMLSLGVQRMAEGNAVVKKLPAVETLGSATWICSDKTGTLTQNRMSVIAVSNALRSLSFSQEQAGRILKAAMLCCNVSREEASAGKKREERKKSQSRSGAKKEKGKAKVMWHGEATELAIVRVAQEMGYDPERIYEGRIRIGEIPFTSARKRMTTIYRTDMGEYFSITKGAPDFLLSRCSFYDAEGQIKPLGEKVKNEIRRRYTAMSEQALRVLAVAYREKQSSGKREKQVTQGKNEWEDMEENLVFLGLIGMMDPPRPEVKECIKTCKEAGITPVMITGDHVLTASAIAKELGILARTQEAVTGEQLDRMSEEELREKVGSYRVFARVSPEHKVRIVKALQAKGEIVAMTGDGVNDAPALKAADIGCAMGENGTDVAKNAADMVLMDDNFATIVKAVQEGRGIYDNIRKSVHFLLSSNIGEIITILAAILCRMPTPLAAVQLLWVNLITDSLPAIALGVERPESDIMKRKPLPPQKGLFSDGLAVQIAVEGMMIGLLAMIAYMKGGGTCCFAVLSFAQLFHAFNMRSSKSIFRIGIFKNHKMVFSFVVCSILQFLVLFVPQLTGIFQVRQMSGREWLMVAGLSVMPIVICEIQKWLRKKDTNE